MKKINKFKIYFVILLILIGIVSNPWVLENLLSPQALIGIKQRIPILQINIALIMLGLFLIYIKFDKKTLERYKLLSTIVVSALILGLFLKAIALGYLCIRDTVFYRSFLFTKHKASLSEIYPDLNKKNINKLLEEIWLRPYVYEPYTQFSERPFKGAFVNVHEAGFRYTKNQGSWPPDKNNLNIFFFGGSTAFNYGLPDNDTIASFLQDLLQKEFKNKKICIYNFAQGYYFSSQECIFLKKLIAKDFIPDAAIFIDGLNEFYHLKDEPIFTERLKKIFSNHSYSKLSNTTNKAVINEIVSRYKINKKITEAICNEFKIKSFFIWQPISNFKYDPRYHIFSAGGFGKLSLAKDGYEFVERNNIKDMLGANFLYLADMQENLKKPLYVDKYHYSAYFSKLVAEKIYGFIKNKV